MQLQERLSIAAAVVFTTSDNEGNFMKNYEMPFMRLLL
jgi:hypothetical protein